MKRMLSIGRGWAIDDFADEACTTPCTYRIRAQTNELGLEVVESNPRVPPERYEAVLAKLRAEVRR